jgi:neutral ceramidase
LHLDEKETNLSAAKQRNDGGIRLMNTLRVGFARADITPDRPVHMAGYGWRSALSRGVHDRLFANAVALSDGAATVLILATDLVSFDLEGNTELKGALSAATGLPPESILTNTSHTHAGPMVVRSAYQPFEAAYFGSLLVICAQAAVRALDILTPARLFVGTAALDIGKNRRYRTPEGEVAMVPNPGGQSLPQVTVWRLQRAEGEDVVLWSAPIHGVVMHEDNLFISAEWMGAAVRDFEALQPGAKAIFLQGCCGDQNPYRELNSFDQVEALGRTAGQAIRSAMSATREVSPLPLVNRYCVVALPVDKDKLPPDPVLVPDGPRPQRPPRDHQLVPIHGLRLGEALLVGMAGEPFVEYARFGSSISPAASTMILGYTDSTLSYLPTEQAYREGGYEPGAWIWYPEGKPWLPTVEGVLKTALAEMIQHLWQED